MLSNAKRQLKIPYLKVIEITINYLAYHSIEGFSMVKLIIFAIGLIAFCNQFDNTLGIIYADYSYKLGFQDNFKIR